MSIVSFGTVFGMPSCGDILFNNLVAGLRDGAVTAVTGVVEESINTQFGLEPEEEGEPGGDLFVNI
jgi:hypothetical protein